MTVPVKFAAGVKTSVAAWAAVTGVPATTGVVPLARKSTPSLAGGSVVMVTKSTVPSGSVPVRSTAMVGASSAPLDVEGVAVGRSIPGVTVMTSLAVDAETLPSLSVTVNGIVTVPLKLTAGVKTSVAACAAVTGVPATTGVVPSAR